MTSNKKLTRMQITLLVVLSLIWNLSITCCAWSLMGLVIRSVTIMPQPVATLTSTPKPTSTIKTYDPIVSTFTPKPFPTDIPLTLTSTPTLEPTATNIPPSPVPIPTSEPVPTLAPSPTDVPPTTIPEPTSSAWDCSGNVYNCSNFMIWADAQNCYEYCLSMGSGDIHDLDRDDDGIACESLR